MSGKVKATFLLLAMYALGLISGIVWQNYQNPHGSSHHMYSNHKLRRLKRELNLTPEQEQALALIFNEAHERAKQVNEEVSWDLADIHRDSVTAIKRILTPEQNQKFDQLHRRSHDRRHEPLEEPAKTDESPARDAGTS